MAKLACPKCNSKKLYKMQSGKRRCALYKYEFIPHKLPLTFSREEWKELLHLFLMEQSSNSIAEQTGFEQRRVLRALTKIRFVMKKDVPGIFSCLLKLMKPISVDNGKQTKNDSGQGNKTRMRDQETTGVRDPLSRWYCLG